MRDSAHTTIGWEVAAAIEPVREASGDFYGSVPLPSGRLAPVVADVANDGSAAVLYMALTRALLRSSDAFDAQPPEGEPFGLARLLVTVRKRLHRPAAGIRTGLLDEIHRFVGDAPRVNDLTLVVVART